MKCLRGQVLITLLALGVFVCKANPVKQEPKDADDLEREKRQMKGGSATADQAEVKFLGVPMLSPVNAAATGALQAVANNLQTGRQNGFMVQGAYANLPGLGYGFNVGGLGAPGQPGGPIGANGNLATTLTSYPSGYEMYPQYMYNSGFYPNGLGPQPPNIGGPSIGNVGPYGPLENSVNYANMQGLSTQLVAQPSQLQQQITPYPGFISGFYPQMGYSPAYQNFQG